MIALVREQHARLGHEHRLARRRRRRRGAGDVGNRCDVIPVDAVTKPKRQCAADQSERNTPDREQWNLKTERRHRGDPIERAVSTSGESSRTCGAVVPQASHIPKIAKWSMSARKPVAFVISSLNRSRCLWSICVT